MFQQESGGRHFRIPSGADGDSFVIVGLDRNDKGLPDRITSRGYGLGQFTIEHHPPSPAEIRTFILNPASNVQTAFTELRKKFDRFVLSSDPARRADDRIAERPLLSLRSCKYPATDTRYLADCRNCAAAARKVDRKRGDPLYRGSSATFQPTQYYADILYRGVPDRAEFGCDWPYAVRRYNGSGVNSFHYQSRVLLNLLNLT